jgi:AbiV family abortive infection protein
MKNTTPDYFEGYKLSIANAKKHFECAELIVKDGISFGIATSHLVLSSEEAVKAAMLFFLDYDPEIKIEDFDKYFSDHKHKHKTISALEFGLSFKKNMIDTLVNPAKERFKRKGDYLTKEEIQESGDEGVDNLIKWFDNILNETSQVKTNEEWWKQANSKKNAGFYVELNRGNGKWKSPDAIAKEEYLKTKAIVENLMKDLTRLEEIFFNEEVKKLLLRYKEIEKRRKTK